MAEQQPVRQATRREEQWRDKRFVIDPGELTQPKTPLTTGKVVETVVFDPASFGEPLNFTPTEMYVSPEGLFFKGVLSKDVRSESSGTK